MLKHKATRKGRYKFALKKKKKSYTYNPSRKPSMRAWKRGLLWGMV